MEIDRLPRVCRRLSRQFSPGVDLRVSHPRRFYSMALYSTLIVGWQPAINRALIFEMNSDGLMVLTPPRHSMIIELARIKVD